jgi:tetratricopeptide (TPR) repeat protein
MLGTLAADYSESEAAINFWREGIAKGAVPAEYWLARIGLAASEDDVAALDAVRDYGRQHALGAALLAIRDRNNETAINALDNWGPSAPKDRAIKTIILSRCHAAQGNLNQAIEVALQGAEDIDSAGVAIQAAELLLSRARFGPSEHPYADSEQALALALRARNSRRSWAGDSTAAALIAVRAAVLSGDTERGLSIVRGAPNGDATEAEASDLRLLREDAVLSALEGDIDRAQELAARAGDAYISDAVAGHAALVRGDSAEAAETLMRAFDSAPDDASKLQTAASLAELDGELPDLSELEVEHSELVQEIKLIHQVTAGSGGDIKALRAHAHKSRMLTVRLSSAYSAADEFDMAGEVLREGAVRWADPLMMRMAAGRYLAAGQPEKAQSAAERAIALGGVNWAGEFITRGILFDSFEMRGLLDDSMQQARRMVALDSNSAAARWALVHCLVRKGDTESAWSALTPGGHAIEPRDRDEARTWIALMAMYDTSDYFVSRALEKAERWQDDEEMLGIYIAQIYSALQQSSLKPTEADMASLQAAIGEYLKRFPTSKVFRAVAFDPDDPLKTMSDILKEQYEHRLPLAESEEKVHNGEMPLGMLSFTRSVSYAEAVIRRMGGVVRAYNAATQDAMRNSLIEALDSPVAIDMTAAHTLALLDVDLRSILVGQFAMMLSTDAAFQDARMAQQSLGVRSTLSMVWDPGISSARPVDIGEEETDRRAELADSVCEILATTNRRP